MDVEELKIKVAKGCAIIAREGHSDFHLGHFSARFSGAEQYWMKPKFLGLEEIQPENVILLDYDGNKIGGAAHHIRHAEYPIHSEIYRKRPDVNCVIHTHPFYATLLGAMLQPIQPITHDGCLFVGSTAYYDLMSDLILTREQGVGLAECLADNRVVLMRNHGVVVVGSTIEEAVGTAILLERAAKAQIVGLSTGQKLIFSSLEDVRNKVLHIFHTKYWEVLWDYLNRQSQ